MGIENYMDIEDKDELLKALLRDELVTMEAPDPITGEKLFKLTDKGMKAFPITKREISSRLSKDVYALWQHDMVQVAFDEEDFANDKVALTPNAYDVDKVLQMPSDVQVSLAVIKRGYEKAVAERTKA